MSVIGVEMYRPAKTVAVQFISQALNGEMNRQPSAAGASTDIAGGSVGTSAARADAAVKTEKATHAAKAAPRAG